ncbi:MAG: hypothetical protein RLZZ200_520 [Pseudomonadota bacterium]
MKRTAPNYFEHQEKRLVGSVPIGDVVDFEPVQVLEGDAAEISHRMYFDRQQREHLQRAWELLP